MKNKLPLNDTDNTVSWILRVAVITLSMIMVAVIATLMIALFSEDVDNTEIFAIISPAFNTIVGAFVGLLGGLSIKSNLSNKGEPEPPSDDSVDNLIDSNTNNGDSKE